MLRQPRSIAALAVLLALTTASELTAVSFRPVLAQSPAPTVPSAVPEGTTVRIDGSTSMAAINQALKQKFESQFSGAKVELGQGGTEAALQALQAGNLDLVALGRPLTPEEKAAGLVQTPVARRKVAVVVGDRNPFPGDMTGEQFAQIFRGEITNWSQVGGANKTIRLIDRPASDTRTALQSYPVFQSAPFKPGATAVSVADESVDAMIQQLGDDGISYAVFDQVANKPGVKIVSLYGTPPSDPSYPFSQALTYVYKGANPNPAVQAFLGYATAPDNQQTVATAGTAVAPFPTNAAQPSPNGAVVGGGGTAPQASSPSAGVGQPSPEQTPPGAVAQAPGVDVIERTGVPWWLWLLSIPVIGALLWVLFRGFGGSDAAETRPAPVPVAPFAADRGDNRLILVPRNSQDAYAYWEVSEADKQRIRQDEGGQQLALRLYDVTGLEFGRHPAHSIRQFDCEETDQDLHIPVPESNRDYLAELGYVTNQGRWVKLAESDPVRVSAVDETEPQQFTSDFPTSDFPTSDSDFPTSDFSPPTAETPTASESSAPPVTPILPTFPRLGDSFRTGGTPLIDPAQSSALETGTPEVVPEIAPETEADVHSEAAAGVAGVGASAVATDEATAGQRPSRVKRSQIVLVPRNSQDAYAYWEVLNQHKEIAKQYGGQDFILRICDITGIDLNRQAPHSIQQFNCEETDRDRHVTVPDRGEYVAEIGYLAQNGRWLRIARSAPVMIPDSSDSSEL